MIIWMRKRGFAEAFIEKVEKIVPGLRKHIMAVDVTTPRTFKRYNSDAWGSHYTFDQSTETRRLYFKTPIKGLYLVGASIFPRGGVEATVISWIIYANNIDNWRTRAS